ncbi:MAG: F-box protein [Parachlamydiaceae bacterium]|nr:MAG: F-box protein [Parachlamydiaceae bacterium]
MSSVANLSPFQQTMSDEVYLHILAFLDNRSLQAVACTSKRFKRLAKDFQIWKPRTELEFGKVVAEGAKQSNKSWKQTHDELSASKNSC